MTKKMQEAKRLVAFRRQRGWTCENLAALLGTHRSNITAWETGRNGIPADICFRLSALARDPKTSLHWLREGGATEQLIISVANKIVGDRIKDATTLAAKGDIVLIPRFWETREGRKPAGPPVPLPAECIPNPDTTICISVDEHSDAIVEAPRGIFVLDTAVEGAEDLLLLWNHVIMLRYSPEFPSSGNPVGVYAGRLRLEFDNIVRTVEPDILTFMGYLDFLTGPFNRLVIGRYVPPERRSGIAGRTFGKHLVEIEARARSAFRMYGGLRVLGLVEGRLTGHIARGAVRRSPREAK